MTGVQRERAYAKLNLALHVRGRRADGYHDIETLFAFCTDGDELRAEPADRLSLTLDGPFAGALAGEASENLVLRAAHALAERTGAGAGAALTLTKRLPVAAGIGGGSADAAAALRLLARVWEVSLAVSDFAEIAASLGADVAACLGSTMQRGTARGDVLRPAGAVTGTPVLLVNPGVALATGPVFAGWDGIDRGPLADREPLAVALAGRNDLTASAVALRPEIGAVLACLEMQPGVTLARMSGSGATCFALFEDASARDTAARAVAMAETGWWCLPTVLR